MSCTALRRGGVGWGSSESAGTGEWAGTRQVLREWARGSGCPRWDGICDGYYAIHSETGAAASSSGCVITSTRLGPDSARAFASTASKASGSSTRQDFTP